MCREEVAKAGDRHRTLTSSELLVDERRVLIFLKYSQDLWRHHLRPHVTSVPAVKTRDGAH